MHEDMQKLVAEALYGKKRRSKFNVDNSDAGKEARTADNIVFDSIREKNTYLELKASLKAGILRELELQVRFPLIVNGVKVCTIVVDFKTIDREGKVGILDAKGFSTPVYKLKRKLFEAVTGLRIVEV